MKSKQKNKISISKICTCFLVLNSCQPVSISGSVVPAEEFAKAANSGDFKNFSFKKATEEAKLRESNKNELSDFQTTQSYLGEKKFTDQGLVLKRSFSAPKVIEEDISNKVTMGGGVESSRGQLGGQGSASSPSHFAANSLAANNLPPTPYAMALAQAPSGSSAPYLQGQMTANPSLWPDRTEGVFLLNDHRAFNPMDVITITINDNTQGFKLGNTQTKTQFDLLAGITNFFGIETKSWESNNTGLDSGAMINASTDNEFKGQAQIQRQAQLRAQVSAIVMEVLPNGTLRIEGSKIVAINNEEEIMVISGLVRKRDIAGDNMVDSNRIANMRIDFYGHGTLSESQSPGWASKIFNVVWPF